MGVVVGIALVWFVIEMLLWYLVAQFVSGWWVFFWFIIAAFIGLMLIKKAANTLNPMAQQLKQMQNGVIPNPANHPAEATVARSVAMGVAGILFLLPGLLSDVGGLILLLPFVQRKLTTTAKNYALKNQDKVLQMMSQQMGGKSPFGMGGGINPNSPFGQGGPFGYGGFGGATVDGEARTVQKEAKRLKSANEE
ncbi:FxsA family protein [Moraxella sp. Tifton1]|uniref:FxsA family protein n=1 Tax=Moraxella oculi TaxID=2940516 RepID=UPI0020121AEC|nr:FxsA family protein [Moraxella sp. Tifton1]MCL1622723.1 FxsA family protein [Moraxella sp. Tifton1]